MQTGCSKLFDLSPYDAIPPDDLRDLTASNIAAIGEVFGDHQGPIVLGLTSDPHFYYGHLKDLVTTVNADPSIALLLVCGDLADQGLVGEFEWFTRNMLEARMPWLTVIGNHDHLSNGRVIYESMFGQRNYTVDLGPYRLICFDDVVWESSVPVDTAWMRATLNDLGGRIPLVMTHIPPFTDQLLETGLGDALHAMWRDAGVPLVMIGHRHGFQDRNHYGDGVRYVSIPWPRARQYVRLTMDGPDFQVELKQVP